MAELPRAIDSISFGFDLVVPNGVTAHEIESSKLFSKYIEFHHRSLLSIQSEWWIPLFWSSFS